MKMQWNRYGRFTVEELNRIIVSHYYHTCFPHFWTGNRVVTLQLTIMSHLFRKVMRVPVTGYALRKLLVDVIAMWLVMTVNALHYVFVPVGMTLGACQFMMFGSGMCKQVALVCMTTCAKCSRQIVCIRYVCRTVGLVTFKAVCHLHAFCMPFMTVKAGLILSFTQSVVVMTGVAVLLGVRTRMGLHLLSLVLMTCHADRLAFINVGKVDVKRMVGIMTFYASLDSKVPVFSWIMAH